MGERRVLDLAKEAVWRRRLARHAKSGQSIRSWCRRHRVKEATFHWWRRELARRDAEAQGTSFVPVQLTDDAARDGDAQIEIELSDGRRVRITGTVNREMLTNVLEILERRAC